MYSLLIRNLEGLHRVDRVATDQVLAKAVAMRAEVDLRADCDGVDVTCCGTLVAGDRAALSVHVGLATNVFKAARLVNVALELNGGHYEFETRCLEWSGDVEPGVIRLARPDWVSTADRRRSPRRRLRQAAEVVLRSVEAKDEPGHVATMLNVSSDGIAIRTAAPDAKTLVIGSDARVSFNLGTSARPFELTVRVVNITPAGTPDQVVVGLEFVADAALESCRDGLLRALEAPDPQKP